MKCSVIPTFICSLNIGNNAKICTAIITVTNACQDEGRREAKQTEPNMAVFNDAAFETLHKQAICCYVIDDADDNDDW